MARIAGVDIPKNKRGVIALTYIFGLGKSRAIEILEKAQVSQDKKFQDWNDDEIGEIRDALYYYKIEVELRSEVSLHIKRLMDIGFYRGIRH
jgi:small subunit ribosomal protein S13